MSVRQPAICFFFLTALCGQYSDIITAQEVHSGREGEDLTVGCRFYLPGTRMFFCRETCDNKNNILLQTDDDSAENHKYKIDFRKGGFLEYSILSVTIRQLTKSDEGRYRCQLGRSFSPDGHEDFMIRVTDGLVVYVLVAWGVITGLLVLSVLIFCQRRRAKTKDAGATAAEDANMMEQDSRVYEEIDHTIGQSKPPDNISTVYTTLKNIKAERNDGAPEASGSTTTDLKNQKNSENIPLKRIPPVQLHSASSGDTNDTLYSLVRVHTEDQVALQPN